MGFLKISSINGNDKKQQRLVDFGDLATLRTIVHVLTKVSSSSSVDLKLQRQSLPVYSARNPLIQEFRKHNCCIVVGETGGGKTTQIPQVSSQEHHLIILCWLCISHLFGSAFPNLKSSEKAKQYYHGDKLLLLVFMLIMAVMSLHSTHYSIQVHKISYIGYEFL